MFKVLGSLRLILLLCCLCNVSQMLWAQKKLNLQSDAPLPTGFNLSAYTFTDSLSLQSSLQRLVLDLQQRAYLEASVDSVRYRDSSAVAWLYLGPPYRWGQLTPRGIPTDWWRNATNDLQKKKDWVLIEHPFKNRATQRSVFVEPKNKK